MDYKKLILNEVNVYSAYNKTRLGKGKLKVSAIQFNNDFGREMKTLLEELDNETYEPKKYSQFTVNDPKERIIEAPNYRDKIVQHMINNVLSKTYATDFINDSYACIINKGTIKALNTTQSYLRQAKKVYGNNLYAIRVDIQKFFYTVNLELLIEILKIKIKDSWLMNLLIKIIYSGNRKIGLPLGNLTSQLFANIYLNILDHWIKSTLRIKWYVRYADDLLIFINGRKAARFMETKIITYIENKLQLKTHKKKTLIQKINKEITFLGFRIFSHCFLVLSKTRKRLIKKLNYVKNKPLNLKEKEHLKLSIQSSLAFMSLGKIEHFNNYILENYHNLLRTL